MITVRPAIYSRSETKTGFGQARLFPNPAATSVSLIFESNHEEEITLDITDGKGSVFTQHRLAQEGMNTWQLEIAHLPAGIYWIGVQGAADRQVLRLIKTDY